MKNVEEWSKPLRNSSRKRYGSASAWIFFTETIFFSNFERIRSVKKAVALPYFAKNRGRSEEERGSAFLALHIHLKLLKKIVSVKKIQAEALP